jgi:multidrug/hemolysin transport system ATP-binding protein
MPGEQLIRVSHLTKSFDGLLAVDDLSFDVAMGSFFAFLGQNGAGKSTTINMLIGLLAQDSGQIQFAADSGRDQLGVVFQNNIFDDLLSVAENLSLYGHLATDNPRSVASRIDELAEQFGMTAQMRQRFGTLSGGQRRKAEIARALFNSPRLLVLDEPTTGLDPQTRAEVWQIIHQARAATGMTVFLTTHYMEETEDTDEVVIIHHGRKVASGSPAELKARYSRDTLIVTPRTGEDFEAKIDQLGQPVRRVADSYLLFPQGPDQAIDWLDTLRDAVRFFEMRRGSMDDVFLNAVGEKLLEAA